VIASAHGATPQADPRLREEHLGRWQGLTRDEVATRYPAGYARWLAGDDSAFDGREGLAAVADRAVAAVLEALPAGQAPAAKLIVVTHCNTAIGLMGRLLRVPGRLGQNQQPAPGALVSPGWPGRAMALACP